MSSDWGSGFNADVTVKNTGSTATKGWRVTWTWEGAQSISGMWNASYIQTGKAVTVTDAGHNGALAPGATASFGFGAAPGGAAAPALTCRTN